MFRNKYRSGKFYSFYIWVREEETGIWKCINPELVSYWKMRDDGQEIPWTVTYGVSGEATWHDRREEAITRARVEMTKDRWSDVRVEAKILVRARRWFFLRKREKWVTIWENGSWIYNNL